MDMHSRNEYLKRLRERYLETRSKRERGKILDEYCKNTGQNRKYVIRKIQPHISLEEKPKKKRKEIYDGYVGAALAKVWEIFDHPCGQRLEPLLKTETERLRRLGELNISDETAHKLQKISSATIDRKLKREKEVTLSLKKRGISKPRSLLYQKIPTRLNDWNTSVVGNLAVDFVEHCGSSKKGEYANSLSVTEISSGWWEGQALMSRGQYPTLEALEKIRLRTPFSWLEIHPDNDSAFINAHLFKYCQKEKIRFSRSRPNKKNDNCYVEQKNWTHIKKVLGYLRYDTHQEQKIINDLYQNELRLFKNFFQPVMKLKEKTRAGGRVHRKYSIPKTPYQRLMASDQISKEKKEKLKAIYLSLNPAELKRTTEAKLDQLYKGYQAKRGAQRVEPFKKQSPRTVTNYMIQPESIRLPS